MSFQKLQFLYGLILLLSGMSCTQAQKEQSNEFSGSESCIECHENFYKLWQPSYHAQAMMPINAEFMAKHGVPNSESIDVEGHQFHVEFKDSTMMMYEHDGEKLVATYDVIYAMGGHNVYTFLTPFEKGKLQNIPLAYDANREEWFNYPMAGMRHFSDEYPEDEALPWKDDLFAFNTGCYSCHISQLSTNFDLETDTYHTTWKEPGINCETCHGPAGEHVRIFKALKEGEEADKLGLISTKVFTQEQNNAACAPCHAKMNPITPSFMPGDKFFDNYNLTTLEDRDFYPDGRSLGENYTMTEWMMNPCIEMSDLHCVTCHTSSGRDRNRDNPNQACLNCHTNRIKDMETHTGHPEEVGLTCLSCHMPKREFVGRFLRSDHSFRPPMPEATIKFGSPNACNQCHKDKSPEWANQIVKARPNGDYQEETLQWAQMIKEARDMNWENVEKMYEYIRNPETDEVVANSLIRLLGNFPSASKTEVLIDALNNKSELVRSSAAYGLGGIITEEVKYALLKACQDNIRLVRVQAANAILSFPQDQFTSEQRTIIADAEKEYVASMTSRLDSWSNHYNLGLYYQNKGEVSQSLSSYETAARLYPESVLPLINSSVLYSYVGNNEKAEQNLKKVLEFDPKNEAANLNLGLLLAEQGRMDEAEKALVTAFEANPEQQGVAAKNLCVILANKGDLSGAVKYAEAAYKASPENPNYGYTLAYYQMQNGQKSEAIIILEKMVKGTPEFLTAMNFLADIYWRDGKKELAIKLYQDALKINGISDQDKAALQQALNTLKSSL
ncbi:ammonia-forming cytochrome c nitrite reductase subunit c552 [Draconibacterium orientale]|uniref:ammonia-forming cytochrome c nitrite reductase subunit c552 n=1 Tax=Draconibacterium orientale TaxID=1168034 RepID=UPI002ABE73BF|nr:ammonia-forming cytochrome c nitrite reductase subunit c552 [Draconibacterium orientale]